MRKKRDNDYVLFDRKVMHDEGAKEDLEGWKSREMTERARSDIGTGTYYSR